MSGRPRIYDEEQVIDKAIQVFWDQCYEAASADELLEAMGIGKGSFYLNFKGGKQELYERSIKQFAKKFHKRIEQGLETADDPIEYIKQFFIAGANASTLQKNRGCYYGNALVQLTMKEKETKLVAAQMLHDLRVLFVKAIVKAKEKGRLSKDADAELLGWHLINFWNGINVTRRMEQSPKVLREIIDLNFRMLE